MNMKKRLLALLGAALILVQVPAVLADQLEQIQQRGVLRVAVPQDFPHLVPSERIFSRKAMTSIWRIIWPIK